MKQQATGEGWRIAAIETPGADYPPPEEFTEDLENEDVPPEKLSGPVHAGRGGKKRAGGEKEEEEQKGPRRKQ